MAEDEILTLPQISGRIYEAREIKLRVSTIERLLDGYASKYGQAPLEKLDDSYRLNRSYYECRQKKLQRGD